MPKIRIDVLVNLLRSHVARLHEIYVDCSNVEICDRLLKQILQMEFIITELRQIQ
mgnify:CR=1 FL=1